MKTFFKKYWSVIFLIIILIVISVLSFVPGKYLLSNDNYSPELNPGLTILRSIISPAWRSYRVLGFASDSEQADIFRTGLMGLFNIALPSSSVAQIFSLTCLWTGVLSMAFLTRAIARDFVKTKYSNVIFLLSGIIYLTTLWTAWVFNFNMMPYITQYGFLPLLILSLYYLFSAWSPKKLLFVFISAVLFTATSVIATLFLVDIVVIIFFIFLFGYLFEFKIKRIVYTIGIILITQLFWILPFIHYTYSTSNDVINSSTNRAITSSTIDLEKQMMTLENSARFYTRLLGTTDDSSQNTYVFPQSNDYTNYDFFKVLGYIPLFFSILGLLFVIIKKKFNLIPLWIALFVFLFLLKNQNAPLGGIYIWLQDNIPIFKQIFRWVSSKLCQPYLMVLTITSGVGFLYFVDYLGSFLKKKTRYIPVLILSIVAIAGLLGFSEYLFKGNLFTQRASVTLPSEYKELATYLENDPQSRIYYAPPSNNGYFREYSWGFVGSQFLGYVLPNPLMDMSLAIGSDVGERGMLKLDNDFESGSVDIFTKELNKYDVKYILVDRSLIKGRYGYELNWEALDMYTKSWNLVWQKNFLELYEIPSVNNETYIESLSGLSGTFERESSISPILNAFSTDSGNFSISNGYLIQKFKYSGISQFVALDPSKIDQETLPSTISYNGKNEITVSPTIPIVADLNLKSKKIFKTTNDFEYLVVSKNVYPIEALQKSLTTEETWGSFKTLLKVRQDSFTRTNYTEILKNSQPGNCAGDKYRTIPDIVSENVASGFSIKGTSELPCVSTKVAVTPGNSSVGVINVNWEAQADNLIGICVFSGYEKKCLNDQKYFDTQNGYGSKEILIPNLILGNDDITLLVYALNPSGNEAKLVVRDISIAFSNTFETIPLSSQQKESDILTASIINGDNITVKTPIIYGSKSSIYLGASNTSLWHPNKASDSLKEYSVSYNDGMVQRTQGQYLNQYENILRTEPYQQYLWVWEGKNISNITASVCLTYQGDDKCWLDDTFFDTDESNIVAKLFTTSFKYSELDASFNSTSYSSLTENILKNFIVMKVPQQWLDLKLTSTVNNEYIVTEAQSTSGSIAPAAYKFKNENSLAKSVILTIPQSQAKGWVAITEKGNVLTDSVTVNGWKQGWDISNTDFNTIYIFYWPNFLGYLGYILIVVEFTYLLIKVFRKRTYAKR
jgi:hypothetical protein